MMTVINWIWFIVTGVTIVVAGVITGIAINHWINGGRNNR